MRAIRGFTVWINRGSFTTRDLAIFRIVCAALLIGTPRSLGWVAEFPNSLFKPPPGPFQWFSSLPSVEFFNLLSVAIVVATILMGIGLFTRWASIAVTVLGLVGIGFSYSFGKIDHSIVLLIAPLILSFANWGAVISVDAALRKREVPEVRQWPVRLLAIAMGCSFATAAYAKISTGWLDPGTQAVKGYFLRTYYTSEHHNVFSEIAQSIQAPALWEVMDWVVVVLEFTMAIAFLSWRVLRVGVAFATLFHLGVFLLLGIDFYWNVIAYGAFVSWGRLIPWRLAPRQRRIVVPIALVIAGLAGLWAALEVTDVIGGGVSRSGPIVLWVGAIAGVAYLIWWFVRLVRRIHPAVGFSSQIGVLPGRAGSIILAIVVVILIVAVPLTIEVKERVAEPYPALFQPDFNGPGPLIDSRIRATKMEITVVFEGGKRVKVQPGNILPSPIDQAAEFAAAFSSQKGDNNPETRRWLKARIEKEFPTLKPKEMTVTWVRKKYDHISGATKYTAALFTRTVTFSRESGH